MKIDLGKNAQLDLKRLVTSRLLVQANSGGGKSWALRRILEQTHGHVQQIVIDPEDEFYTLREKHDYILIRHDGGDAIPEIRSAELLARRLLELGVSAIIDLYELSPRDRREWVKRFLNALTNSPKVLWHPLLLVLDEAHEFCPEQGRGGKKDDSKTGCAEAVILFMSKGRKRGFCGILATQRISKLNKDAAAEANNKLIGRAVIDVDRKRAAEELGFTTKEDVLSLRLLDPGTFFAFGPALFDDVTKIKTGAVHTTHPEAGDVIAPVAPPKSKVKSILAKLADLPKEADQERATVADLQLQVRTLRAELDRAEKAQPKATVEIQRKEILVVTEAQLRKAEKLFDRIANLRASEIKRTDELVGKLSIMLSELSAAIAKANGPHADGIQGNFTQETAPPGIDQVKSAPKISRPEPPKVARPGVAADVVSSSADSFHGSGEIDLPPRRQRLLNALLFFEQLGQTSAARSHVSFFCEVSPTSSTFEKDLSALRSAGLLDYPSSGFIALTDAGRAEASIPIRISLREFQEKVCRLLPPRREKIARALIANYPQALSREDLAANVGSSETSSTFEKDLSAMRSAGLLDYPGKNLVVATDSMFPNLP